MDYNNKIFQSVSNTPNGEVGSDTRFYYYQGDNIVTGTYNGGSIVAGQILGKIIDEKGTIEMRYQHINDKGELLTGICTSTPEILPSGKIRLLEKYKWTCRDGSEGESVSEEV